MARISLSDLRQVILYSMLSTALIEAVTVFFRFGLRLESTKHTASTVGWLTGGVRIHHGYLGLVAILIAVAVLRRFPEAGRWLIVIGVSLVLSDAIHHLLVLWPIVGDPQFHLVYP